MADQPLTRRTTKFGFQN